MFVRGTRQLFEEVDEEGTTGGSASNDTYHVHANQKGSLEVYEESRINKGWRERGVRQREDQLISVNMEMKVVMMLRKTRDLATRPKGAGKVLDLPSKYREGIRDSILLL